MSNGQLTGEAYTTGCLGANGVRIWFFFGFLLGFGSLIGASWILFGEYVTESNQSHSICYFWSLMTVVFFSAEGKTFHPKSTYPGVAIFLQNACIFFASLIYKFGRSEDLWG